MERRRRARINAALAELKALIADTIRQEVCLIKCFSVIAILRPLFFVVNTRSEEKLDIHCFLQNLNSTKLEKADILELTVKHVRAMNSQLVGIDQALIMLIHMRTKIIGRKFYVHEKLSNLPTTNTLDSCQIEYFSKISAAIASRPEKE